MNNQFLRYPVLLLLTVVGMAGAGKSVVFAQAADDCSWTYAGSDRAAVKNRPITQESYTQVNAGKPITIADWYDLVCPMGKQVPPKSEISDKPMPGLETQKVTLRGFILTAKFERGEDHDIHAEV